MEYKDINLKCSDCGNEFTFSAENQEYFATRGLRNQPKRCFSCRKVNRINKGFQEAANSDKNTYPITCAQCGGDDRIPFPPRPGRPYYCSNCFSGRMQYPDTNKR